MHKPVQAIWEVIPDSGSTERESEIWLNALGKRNFESWKKSRVLGKLTPDQLISAPRRLNLGEGSLNYDLEKDDAGFLAFHSGGEMSSRRVGAGDPRIDFLRFDLNAYLEQLAAVNNITERPTTPSTGQSGVFHVGESRVGQTSFQWIVVLNSQWLTTFAAEKFLDSLAGDKRAGILLVPAINMIPQSFLQRHTRIVPLELPIETFGIDPANYCTRSVLKFEEARHTLSSTKKVVINKEEKVILLFDRQLKVKNSLSKWHEFLIAVLEHGRPEPQLTNTFAHEHLGLNPAKQDVLQKVRAYKTKLRVEFAELFSDQPEIAEYLASALLESEGATVACKIDRAAIIFW